MSSCDAEPDENEVELTLNELTDILAAHRNTGPWANPEVAALCMALIVYSKAFVEALARRHADELTDLLRTRIRRNGDAEIGLDGDAAATVVVTGDLPDEARLALLDLDVTADAVRGKVLRWDDSVSAWRPDPDQ